MSRILRQSTVQAWRLRFPTEGPLGALTQALNSNEALRDLLRRARSCICYRDTHFDPELMAEIEEAMK